MSRVVKMERTFGTYWSVLKRRFWVILLLVAATMAVVLIRAAITPPLYRSSMRLQIIPLEPGEVTLYTRMDTVSSSDTISYIYFDFSELLKTPRMAQLTLADTGLELSIDEFLRGVSVERDPIGDLMSVSVSAASPEVAELLLQRHVDIALEAFRSKRALPTETSSRFLETELAQAEKDLEAARSAVLRFKLANRIESLDRTLAAEEQAIRDLNGAQQASEIDSKRLQAVIGVLEAQLKDAEAAVAAEADSAAAAGAARLVQDLRQQIGLRRVDAASRQAEAEAVLPLIAKREANLASLITLGGQYEALRDVVQEKLDTRNFLQAKAREARLKENQTRSVGYLSAISAPTTPGSQLPTQTVRTALLGALLSIVAGIILVYLLEFIERALRHSPAAAPRAQEREA